MSPQHVWFLSIFALAHGMDKTRLQYAPPPMNGFQVKSFIGRWYIQFRSAPCSWSGSAEFLDYETTLSMDDQNNILARETMRNDMCNTVSARLYTRSPPGVFTVKDPLGNNWSGSYIVPATDYKSYCITYGCTKLSTMRDKCVDPWLSVKTRMPNPEANVIVQINDVLMRLWGITIDHLQQVQHHQSCLVEPEPASNYPGPLMSEPATEIY